MCSTGFTPMIEQNYWNAAAARPRRADGAVIHTIAAGIRLLRGLVGQWRRRAQDRYALLAMSERDLRDIGLTCLDAAREAEKPFWRG